MEKLCNNYSLIIKSTLKNSLFFLYDSNGLVKQWSVKSQKYKKLEKKHNTLYNINTMIEEIRIYLIENKIMFLNLIFIGIGLGREEFEKNFDYSKFTIINIFDKTKIPFNGCRTKKRKRI